ncbi:MAG: response regulator, partial [Candidatus Omnitrophica bacterium]|nr:response regulator [Candidatus Omnitrophota bacterium]
MCKKILVVDDDQSVSNSLALLLREERYLVDNTSDSGQGAFLIEKNVYDVCLFDYKMKGLTGIDLLKMAKNKNPRCVVFIVSGTLDIDALRADESVVRLVASIISKPFHIEALLQKISNSDLLPSQD